MNSLKRDLLFALRQLRRSPGFAAAAILTLAVGIGANTAIFSVVNQALLRPLPYPEAQELRAVTPVLHAEGGAPDTLGFWSYPMYEAFRRTEHGFDALAAYTPNPRAYNLAGAESPQRVRVEMVSAGYFPLLGVGAAHGRTFLPEEDATPGAAPVAVLGHGLWERSYGSDPSVVGREISLNSIPFEVVGVLPRGFAGLSGEADVWVPMMMAPALTFPRRLEGALSFWHYVIARAPAGETEGVRESRLDASARSVEEGLPLA
ncbi:MAG: ABC transporter permease, partial [Gemmatimonadota bacterium]